MCIIYVIHYFERENPALCYANRLGFPTLTTTWQQPWKEMVIIITAQTLVKLEVT